MERSYQQTKTYDIHPISIKQIIKGHPWVTIDKYSEQFNPREKFIVAANKKRPFALLIHDPTHKNIRARVWSTRGDFQKSIKNFKGELKQRLIKSFDSRIQNKILDQRNNFYLVFGEGDELPGLNIQYLNGEILIQFYMNFWEQYQEDLFKIILTYCKEHLSENITRNNLWIQKRADIKEPAKCLDPNISFKEITVTEFFVKYKVVLGKFYDHGIYTDMSAIRAKLSGLFDESKSVLNLFSYTGAFSLYALKKDADKVVSIDLSDTYIEWLEENIKLNNFDKDKHQSIVSSVSAAISKMIKDQDQFDLIISDPPSSSSDKNKRSNAFNDYKEYLPKYAELLAKDGHLIAFLNTHKTTMRKFEDQIVQIIKDKNLPLKLVSKHYLAEDCPHKKGFPEGSYLKGILLKKS